MVSASIARPSASVLPISLIWFIAASAELPRPKNTSGLVHAATARRMCVVRKDSPTWYAAEQFIQTHTLVKFHATK